ncbi:thermonuclease family protein [Synechococcus sp. EJ6-Ellesmere]|uniref:thermonuclease family protein n=1 Tax=Synechococcus sp. EJ6-Ellesmere TaxID=2823734 RepID=UPI0020CB8E4D|nr:thermonuclease family protein [Synechococcus sp. EJ6-Ellesmere]MCP9824903.1 thermonuclease family protein [Synechococcus sp. EJ6-Ellesmere]
MREAVLPWLLCVGALLPWLAVGETRAATVLSIGDGDTIRVLEDGKRITVRLACIDAPELAQSPFGQQTRQNLQTRLPIGTPVTLAVKGIDRYGRPVAEVIGKTNLGLKMVEVAQT